MLNATGPTPGARRRLLEKEAACASKDAYSAYFFTTAYMNFWGSNDHVTRFIEAVHGVAETARIQGSLIDVGAAPYNVVGGDVSHLLLYLDKWGCSANRGLVMGYEPMPEDFKRLLRSVRQRFRQFQVVRMGPTEFGILDRHERPCAIFRQHAVSDHAENMTMAPQQFAGSNTASLNPRYQGSGKREPGRFVFGEQRVETVTLDAELARRGRADADVLVMKVDVEGLEVAVLEGAREAIGAGRVHAILLEYGDKMAPEIFAAMKAPLVARRAAEAPQQVKGLHWLGGYAAARGYDVFFIGADRGRPVLVGVSGTLWDDRYEVCLDKRAKWSPDGSKWFNYSSWTPRWVGVCWYDIVLLRRASPLYTPLVHGAARLPRHFCSKLARGWYPEWTRAAPPAAFACDVAPRPHEVCTRFRAAEDCTGAAGGRCTSTAAPLPARPPAHLGRRSQTPGKGRGLRRSSLARSAAGR